MARTRPLIVVFLTLLVAQACAVNPATGRRELSFVSEGQEIQMGQESDPQIVASMGLYPDSSVQRYVREIGLELAANSERPNLPWTFRVLDDPTVNAFALPGGFVYVTRGILAHFTSEAQLAGVLGHEIGHVTAKHSVAQMSQQQLLGGLLGIGMILSEDLRAAGDVAGAGLQLLTLKFGRDDETQADELGVRYMRTLDYDPRELAGVMRMLERTGELSGGSGRAPEWLYTHPDPGNRVVHINEVITGRAEDLSGSTVGRTAFLEHLAGMPFGLDPREGFFEDNLFHHPELAFRIQFPTGWQTLNGKTAVQAGPESQDALMGLTLDEGTPQAALNTFAEIEGMRLSGRTTAPVNGLEAAGAGFSITTQDGELEGTVLFVSHGGNTYRLLGYAPASRWLSHRDVVVTSVRSFQRETDPEVLAAQPDRLEIVTLPRSLTLESYVQRYPSTVSAPLVALINQLEEGQSFPSGARVKRVVSGG
jgi:predicted Zn-dependent protease